jgi:septal ring-binding cell division protein DamX
LNPDHFTVQLVAAYNPAVIERVANDHGLTGKLAHYTWKYQGRDWNVLLYGDFPTRELALAARRELPDEIKAFGPWIRRLAWVQRQLTDR